MTRVLANRSYPEQAYKACLGILHLEKHYEKERVEAAAKRALQFNTCSFRSMKSILSIGLDRQSAGREPGRGQLSLPLHQNIRGREYYQKENTDA